MEGLNTTMPHITTVSPFSTAIHCVASGVEQQQLGTEADDAEQHMPEERRVASVIGG